MAPRRRASSRPLNTGPVATPAPADGRGPRRMVIRTSSNQAWPVVSSRPRRSRASVKSSGKDVVNRALRQSNVPKRLFCCSHRSPMDGLRVWSRTLIPFQVFGGWATSRARTRASQRTRQPRSRSTGSGVEIMVVPRPPAGFRVTESTLPEAAGSKVTPGGTVPHRRRASGESKLSSKITSIPAGACAASLAAKMAGLAALSSAALGAANWLSQPAMAIQQTVRSEGAFVRRNLSRRLRPWGQSSGQSRRRESFTLPVMVGVSSIRAKRRSRRV